MGLFRKDLPKEIAYLEKALKGITLKIPDNWVWWNKKYINLYEIEAIDLKILDDISRLHKSGRLNSSLTSKIVSLAKELRELIVKMMRQQNLPEDLQTEEAKRVHLIVEKIDDLVNSTLRGLDAIKIAGPSNWHLYYQMLKIMEDDFDLSEKYFDMILGVMTPFTHPNFYSNLPSNIKDPNVLKLYVLNTVKFVEKPFRDDVDKRYVLFYRRTQPTKEPKPESYWTYSFRIATTGLSREHSPEYVKTSVILVANLNTLVLYQGAYKHDLKDDSIHFIRELPFSQQLCLCIFKQ